MSLRGYVGEAQHLKAFLMHRDEMEVIRQNGFDIQETAEGQLQLTAVPFSKNITFGARDVQELAQLLLEGARAPASSGDASMLTSQTLRPSRWCCAFRV